MRFLLQQEHLLKLIALMRSQMDFNIGAALWFAARGKGHLFQPGGDTTQIPCHSSHESSIQASVQTSSWVDMDDIVVFHKHGG